MCGPVTAPLNRPGMLAIASRAEGVLAFPPSSQSTPRWTAAPICSSVTPFTTGGSAAGAGRTTTAGRDAGAAGCVGGGTSTGTATPESATRVGSAGCVVVTASVVGDPG